ncbi:sodium/potassium-transporting ATPase subunit beta [Paragonimus westermani]|uniref:Sodium/potassium-transporting ATPase subunit beta n=1 Tax=Paragonimus westermani TaxID=34504 RepID=A0A5J4NXR5_9TREM|nr:sodium/potassium-transporting ATPase subunit beta [Paragonimus westermani]
MLYILCSYSVLLLIFTAYMRLLFYFTVRLNAPRLTGQSSMLKLNPGISVIPNPSVLTSLVHIRVSNPASYSALVDEMAAFLTHYQTHIAGGVFAHCEPVLGFVSPRVSCRYNLDAGGPCNMKSGFGYFRGQPCFAVKLNRIYGWLPSPLANATGVRLKCEGLTETDAAYLGKVCYYDMDSLRYHGPLKHQSEWCDRNFGVFNSMFYPFLNQANYQSPVVFVHFISPKRYVVIWIKCYAEARNIQVNLNRNEGSVVFQIMIE